ncbi:MAG: RNA-binding protein [Pseudomonadota bacterium]
MSKKLFIGNCSFDLDETALQALITANGIEVSSVQIIRDRETGRSRGFGFAELSGSGDIQKAIQALNGKDVGGRPLTVNEARERTRSDGPSRSGGFRSERGNGSTRW